MIRNFTKSVFFVAIFLFATLALSAKTINIEEAKDLAQQFLSSNVDKQASPDAMKRAMSKKAKLTLAYEAKAQNGNSNLYVFNQEEKGFVVIAGDDRVSPILGYADEGAFDEKNMPEGFRFWLESCNRYIDRAKASKIKEEEELTTTKPQQRTYASYIEPLLGDIMFTQSDPYNRKCPYVDGERTIVGCVAISMGQIMTYYQWPERGQGSYSYTTTTNELEVSANFNTTYDWDNILHSYEDGDYTTTQANAVAKMLFHCGVSVNMDYGLDGSGTTELYVPKAMTEYFGYDKGMNVHYRAMYNFSEWKDLIKEELNNGRPIIYCGTSEDGGHAFNCDGYDRNDYFHINWGWGGYYNTYCDLRYLDYEDNEATAFRGYHCIVTGIKPDKGDGTETQTELVSNLVLHSGTYIAEGEAGEDTLKCSFWNYGPGLFYGDIAVEVYDETGDTYTLRIFAEGVEISPLRGALDRSIISLDRYEYDGYSVKIVYREEGEYDWKQLPAEKGMIATWIYDADSDSWTEDIDEIPSFQLEQLSVVELSESDNTCFELSITSLNDFDYEGELYAWLYDATTDDFVSEITKSIFVLSGETYTITLCTDELLEDGEYYIYFLVDEKNGWLRYIEDENDDISFPITIGEGSGSISGPQLELYNYSEINKTNFEFGEEIEYTAYIYNSGEAGYANLSIDVHSSSDGWITAITYEEQYVSSGYSTIALRGTLTSSEDFVAGDYYVKLWNNGGEDNTRVIEPTNYNEVAFSIRDQAEQSYPSFELVSDMQLNKTTFTQGETIEATYTIRNTSGVDYYLDLGVAIGHLTENSSYTDLANTQTVYFPAYSEKVITSTVTVPLDFECGEYRMFAYYYNGWSVDNSGYKFFTPAEYNMKHIMVEESDGRYEILVVAEDNNGKTVGSGRYEYGDEVTIAAIPDYGYEFYRWSDRSKKNPRVVTVDGETTYEAEFRAITISLEAQPNDEAFEFVEWSDGVTDNPRQISIAEKDIHKYVAIFQMMGTAVENAYITSAHVYSSAGTLYVIGAESDYLVFDEAGKLIYSGNESSIQIPSGVYLVRLGEEIQKVVVL